MSATIVLAIIVATHNVDDQATEAMRTTAAEAIGGDDAVVVRDVDTPSDREALRFERKLNAHTVAEVVWLDAALTRAQVRVHVAETNRWTERTIAFNIVDTPVERGRALGFAVTSMLPEEALSARPHRGQPRATTAGEGVADAPQTALRLGLIGGTASGTDRPVGGSIAAEFLVLPAIWLRMGGGGRGADVPSLAGTDLTGYAGLGVGYWPWRGGRDQRFAFGVRFDALALYHRVSTPLGTPGTQHKWLPAMDAMAEVGWNVAGSVEIVASLGVELAFEKIDLFTDDIGGGSPTLKGTIGLLRGVGDLGIRISF